MVDQITQSNDTNEEDLFLQIRTAHRLLAAYYQRLLPTIEEIANALELKFYVWEPSEFDRPSQFSSNLFNRWQWDLLPANCTRYVFIDAESKNSIEVGKCLVVFHVISDTGILKENWKSTKTQPDGLDLSISAEKAESVLRVQLYAPYENREAYWHEGLLKKCNMPDLTDNLEAQKVEANVKACISGFEIPLTELICESAVDDIIKRIEKYRVQLISSAKALNDKSSALAITDEL
jgi:hypothetical protein